MSSSDKDPTSMGSPLVRWFSSIGRREPAMSSTAWPPPEWEATDTLLDELHREWLTTVTDGIEAAWEGDHVHLSIVMHKNAVVEYIDHAARVDDHDCDIGSDELWTLTDVIVGALAAATGYDGDLVGDHCDDDEQDDGRGGVREPT